MQSGLMRYGHVYIASNGPQTRRLPISATKGYQKLVSKSFSKIRVSSTVISKSFSKIRVPSVGICHVQSSVAEPDCE